MNDFYVYVYIDPRNFEEFYYGKGRGSRKNAHLSGDSNANEKSRRIAAIKNAGLEPIVRVIARNLNERDAFLVEKTLLWKLGRNLLNVAPGHYESNFRPPDKMHALLNGFDFQNAIYYYNVGDGPHRCWEDYATFRFISAGQGVRWRDAMLGFQPGDIVAAYLKKHGYVGIGRIKDRARPVREVCIDGKPLLSHEIQCKGLAKNAESDDLCEYVATVEWIRDIPRNEAKWNPNSGIFTTTLVRASLDNQPSTIEFLEREFNVDLRGLVT